MQEDPKPASQTDSREETVQNAQKPQRKGQKLFWWLLFSPAVFVIAAIPALSNEHFELFFLVLGIGFVICVYCGFWTAGERMHSTVSYVAGGILMSLAYTLVNLAIAFTGCAILF